MNVPKKDSLLRKSKTISSIETFSDLSKISYNRSYDPAKLKQHLLDEGFLLAVIVDLHFKNKRTLGKTLLELIIKR